MYEIQMYDDSDKGTGWDGVTDCMQGMEAAIKSLVHHEANWPFIGFRIFLVT